MAKTCINLSLLNFCKIESFQTENVQGSLCLYNGKSPPKAVLETNSPRGKPSVLSIWGNKTFIMNKTQFLFYREDKTLFIC